MTGRLLSGSNSSDFHCVHAPPEPLFPVSVSVRLEFSCLRAVCLFPCLGSTLCNAKIYLVRRIGDDTTSNQSHCGRMLISFQPVRSIYFPPLQTIHDPLSVHIRSPCWAQMLNGSVARLLLSSDYTFAIDMTVERPCHLLGRKIVPLINQRAVIFSASLPIEAMGGLNSIACP